MPFEVNSSNLAKTGLPASQIYNRDELIANGMPTSSHQSHPFPNINSTIQQRLRLGLLITNESKDFNNSMDLRMKELHASDYLNVYQASNQISTSIQIVGNCITAPTPTENAMIATIKRLRDQNTAQLTSLLHSGRLASTAIGSGIIDLSKCASVANNNSDCISRMNASLEPPFSTNIAMAYFNRNSGVFNAAPTMR